MCNKKAVRVLLENFFFFAMALLGVLITIAFIWVCLHRQKNHSSEITADHSTSGNDVEVTVIWAQLHGYKPSSLVGKNTFKGSQSFHMCFQALRKKGSNYRMQLWVTLSHPAMNIYATYYRLFKRHCSVTVVTRCVDNCKTNSIFQLTPFLITSHLH